MHELDGKDPNRDVPAHYDNQRKPQRVGDVLSQLLGNCLELIFCLSSSPSFGTTMTGLVVFL